MHGFSGVKIELPFLESPEKKRKRHGACPGCTWPGMDIEEDWASIGYNGVVCDACLRDPSTFGHFYPQLKASGKFHLDYLPLAIQDGVNSGFYDAVWADIEAEKQKTPSTKKVIPFLPEKLQPGRAVRRAGEIAARFTDEAVRAFGVRRI